MIEKIRSVDETVKINSNLTQRQKSGKQNPSFKGLGAIALLGIQKCEQYPMVNVAVIDMLSAILPRTIVESLTNWFAGFEAFRRESSGLIVNCLIPSFITLGIAKCLNPAFMPKGINMAGSWADSDLLTKATDYYKNASSGDKVEEAMRKMVGNLEGFDRENKVLFKDVLGEKAVNDYAKRLTEISKADISNDEMSKRVKVIAEEIVSKTHVAENVKVENVKASTVKSMLNDTVKFYREFQKTDGKIAIEEFAKKSRRLVRTKSLLGLTVVLPLAASMQYINRWITGKVSGTKGAPIYDDFGKTNDNIEENPDAKKGLLKQKIISISSMVGVGLLSMMKMPTMRMLEFKGIFPTMDQARIISTTTFASRMAAADEKNELAESTVRDIATFCGLYFFGDYAAKGMASLLQKKTGVALLNDTKPIDKNASVLKKFIHWVKDVTIKSSDEVVSKTEQALKGLKPTEEQAKAIEKELKYAKNLRAGCQVANIGVSLALLGLIIPIFTRHRTKKKHEQALKLAQANNNTQVENQSDKNQEAVTPLNVKYTNLTAGFRADKKLKTA